MRYSDYTVEQLREELGQLKEASQRAEQIGEIQEVVILERKMQMVASYLLNREDYELEEIYEIQGDPGDTSKISFLEGVMAWAHRVNLIGNEEEKQTALAISILQKK